MNISYSQLMLIPFGYSMQGNIRTYKARFDKDKAEQLVKAIANANITHKFYTKSGKIIVTVREYSTNHIWTLIDTFVPKKAKTSKQLTLNLK